MKKILLIILIVLICILDMTDLVAQCPMCRMAAETNLENGGTEGRGLNTGILYILSLPYIMVATIGFIWWKNNRSIQEDKQ